MTDYSQWLESVKMGHGGLIPLLIVFVLAIMGTIALNFMSDSIGDTRFGVSAVLTSTLLLVFIIVGILVKFCLPPKDTPSFAQRTELRMYIILSSSSAPTRAPASTSVP